VSAADRVRRQKLSKLVALAMGCTLLLVLLIVLLPLVIRTYTIEGVLGGRIALKRDRSSPGFQNLGEAIGYLQQQGFAWDGRQSWRLRNLRAYAYDGSGGAAVLTNGESSGSTRWLLFLQNRKRGAVTTYAITSDNGMFFFLAAGELPVDVASDPVWARGLAAEPDGVQWLGDDTDSGAGSGALWISPE
jgi:hypothetical protein